MGGEGLPSWIVHLPKLLFQNQIRKFVNLENLRYVLVYILTKADRMEDVSFTFYPKTNKGNTI